MRVLIAEDEKRMAELLKKGLEEENHTVAVAGDGLEGIHAAETCDFDAIVVDVMMPGIDGIGLVRRLRVGGRQTLPLAGAARARAAVRTGMPAPASRG